MRFSARPSVSISSRRREAAGRALEAFATELRTHAAPEPEIAAEVCACIRRLASTLKPQYAEAGCFAFWRWVRHDASFFIPVAGVCSLVGFAATLTRVDTAFAGRAYAAYGGIYIAASLVWLWGVEGQRPSATDVLGAGMAIAGAVVIVAFSSNR